MEVRLLVVNEKVSTKQLRLGPETFIGRSPECQLRIASSRVSRLHCLIRVNGNQVTVRDLGSANGTILDGLTVAAGVEAQARPGSKLVVGPLKFVFDFDAPETGYASPADILALAGTPTEDEDTKDYSPSQRRQKSSAGTAQSAPENDRSSSAPSPPPAGQTTQPAPALPPLNPEDTLYDPRLADHARESAQRARDDAESVLSESETDILLDEGNVAPPAGDAALEEFFRQMKRS